MSAKLLLYIPLGLVVILLLASLLLLMWPPYLCYLAGKYTYEVFVIGDI